MDAYRKLEERFGRIARLAEAGAVLHWDSAVMMPSGGAEARSEQLATLRTVTHEMLVDPAVGDWLEEAGDASLDAWQQANLAEMRRAWTHATAVPGELVAELSRKGSTCEMVWRQARLEDDFDRLAPHLRDVLDIVRQTAHAKGEALGLTPYDALLDQYDPGQRAEDIDAIFADLESFLPDFIDAVLDRQDAGPAPVRPEGRFDEATQRELGHRLMAALGFDFDHGRLDESAHPFCGGTPSDVRLTMRTDPDDFGGSLMAVLHETGHALYELGLPAQWRYQPVGMARGMTLHESQSLSVEMQLCRSRAFFDFLAPLLVETYGDQPAFEPDNLFRHFTRVERSLIRVDADEVTYPAHVIMRYRLERQMVAGQLEVDDLPEAWNAAMDELVGVVPPDDRRGCMQDIHWMDGAFGYFPTYTLGAMTAAQLVESARDDLDGLDEAVRQGDFAPFVDWMREHVHRKASSAPTPQLVEQASGRPLDVAAFKRHLRRRYLPEP